MKKKMAKRVEGEVSRGDAEARSGESKPDGVEERPHPSPLPQERGPESALETKYVLWREVRPDPEQPRKVFDREKLQELADSILAVGLRTPIQVEWVEGDEPESGGDGESGTDSPTRRRTDTPTQYYKIVDGERRWRACELAGLERVPVMLVDGLKPEQRLAVQVVLNQQHENLSALEEAGAYAREIESGRHTAESLYKALGISRGKLFGRLALNKLSTAVRKAVEGGEISVSVAGLVAKIPTPEAQQALLEIITKDDDYRYPYSFRDVEELIERGYVRQLGDAPFDTEDEELVLVHYSRDAEFKADGSIVDDGARTMGGACTDCPFRSGNMAELFPELAKRPHVCTKPECYELKMEADLERKVARSRAKGLEVLTDKEFWSRPHGELVSLKNQCFEASEEGKTYAELLGKHKEKLKVTMVVVRGELREYAKVSEVEGVLEKHKIVSFQKERDEEVGYEKEREEKEAQREGMYAQGWQLLGSVRETASEWTEADFLKAITRLVVKQCGGNAELLRRGHPKLEVVEGQTDEESIVAYLREQEKGRVWRG